MNGDVKADDSVQKPTYGELVELMIYDEIIETERAAAEVEATEYEIWWAKRCRSHSVD